VRIGLLGGTFDPIHLGHLRAGELAREALGLDSVLYIPAHVPPHRRGPRSSARDRYAMVCLATAGHACFVPSDLELEREGPSFTIDTLSTLAGEHPGDELVLIVGSDTYPEMAGWRDPKGIFARCQVAVVDRPAGREASPEAGATALPEGVHRVSGATLAISSTVVRSLAAQGRSLRYLVPDAVADYVEKRRLYR
jgi:nicotinate-nucleotide adenylyltransferase